MEPLNVFIADDSAIVCSRLLTLLADVETANVIGFAQTAAEAYDKIRSLRPDVVVLDIRMPGGSGIDALQQIKRDFPRTLIMMFTNYPYAQYSELCRAAGADYFFDKSSEFHRIPEELTRLAEERHERRRREAAESGLLPGSIHLDIRPATA